ncbi:kinesin-like protein KIN-8B [Durio zibethinus]|uniref:Kinesin-like protein KIN-8B n=1 Tax=Durio zibethinus TaxID=66656 RepID=A0A6P5ZIJ3_DURZI|nr:kinesin-like protein KIN-8B [Durio zibethinus]
MVATMSPADSQYHHTKNIGTIDTHVSDYQQMIDSLQERINLQKALFELEETNLRNRTELQHLDDAIAKQQASEKDGTVVEALRVRRQDILDNICDNDEVLSPGVYIVRGMANAELQFEMAMRDQIIHNQREAQRNLWNLLMGLGLDEKRKLDLAAKQEITIEDWTMIRYLDLSNREQSPKLAAGGYAPLSYGLSINQWHSRSSCIYQNYQHVASKSFSTRPWDLSPTFGREEHHSSYYLLAHDNSPPYVRFRSSDNWVGGHPFSWFGTPDKLPRDLRKSYPEMISLASSCNESYLSAPAMSADFELGQKDDMRHNLYSKGPHGGMISSQDTGAIVGHGRSTNGLLGFIPSEQSFCSCSSNHIVENPNFSNHPSLSRMPSFPSQSPKT